jgi:hypothetical protein
MSTITITRSGELWTITSADRKQTRDVLPWYAAEQIGQDTDATFSGVWCERWHRFMIGDRV